MKKKNNKNRKIVLLLVVVLGISIGYAALASNLKINGSTGVKNASWIIHWANPQVVSGSVTDTKPTLSENNTNATYSVTLSKPGDFYEFTIDAVNEGTIDAEILKIESRFDGPEGTPIVTDGEHKNLPAYLEYEVTYADEEHTPIAVSDSLDHGQSKKYRVRVAYSENITADDLQDDDITTTFYFEIDYKQKDDKTTDNNDDSTVKIVDRQVPDDITIGDKVTIGEGDTTQEFTVIDDTEEGVILLSDYKVAISATVPGSVEGLQVKTSRQYMYYYLQQTSSNVPDGIYDSNDEFPFSKVAYWNNNVGQGSSYTYQGSYTEGNYPDVFDDNYDSEPVIRYDSCIPKNYRTENRALFDELAAQYYDERECTYTSAIGDGVRNIVNLGNSTANTYSLAFFAKKYKTTLQDMGATVTNVRLLTLREAQNFGIQNLNVDFSDRAFWLGTAASSDQLWIVTNTTRNEFNSANASFEKQTFSNEFGAGFRPVVVVPKSSIK